LPRVIPADPHRNDRRFNACYQIGKARGLHHVLRCNRRRNPRERDGMPDTSAAKPRPAADASRAARRGFTPFWKEIIAFVLYQPALHMNCF
jgi:hypothetical protein